MNTEMIKAVAAWLEELRLAVDNDEAIDISWFSGTKDSPLSIVGGWADGFDEYDTIFCTSKADPCYAMCVKIAVNNGPYAYVDFEWLHMPMTLDGEVEDTCIALERDEDLRGLAVWLVSEWERLMNEYNNN